MDAYQMLNSHARDSFPREFEQIIGNSPALERVLEQVEHVAPTGFHRSYRRRDRHRKGVDRARNSQPQHAMRASVYKLELRCHSTGPAGK